ncbi:MULTISPECIES: lipid asymmetry maintenance protein MlaB [Methylovorus]|jgi:anti-sigma B factor antagonist|uniref:Anti-sigma-factor antagonist n=1 Tax=Methylovorus glucosotrophus (strain SIP3-4) TaxID=582744 RepID=C6XBI0_METGS|nr:MULTISPECIES: STAS domain-containing protein [Methylovorus]ACT51950.1 anti-sigma-factor antagonist [Methylovorus glucosotrophus SIP3-4]KAF0842772.1 anti-anti-sigma factor [Methylovorus glucosotrophus]
MTITVNINGAMGHVVIEGEMTIFEAAEYHAALLPPVTQCHTLELDLTNVTEIDTSGLQLLVSAKLRSQQTGSTLSITGHSETVQQVLDATDLAGFFGDQVVLTASE